MTNPHRKTVDGKDFELTAKRAEESLEAERVWQAEDGETIPLTAEELSSFEAGFQG